MKINNESYKCSYGRAGLSENKQEGDGATPIGIFQLRHLFYRPDRIKKENLITNLSITPIHKNEGWCDDIFSPYYNRLIKLPFSASHETLWRDDNLYDIFVVVGYNDTPPVKGKGSAIFLHIAKDNYQPTAGCIAFSKQDFLKIISQLTPDSMLHIAPESITLTNTRQTHAKH